MVVEARSGPGSVGAVRTFARHPRQVNLIHRYYISYHLSYFKYILYTYISYLVSHLLKPTNILLMCHISFMHCRFKCNVLPAKDTKIMLRLLVVLVGEPIAGS